MELLMKFYTINYSHYRHLIPLTKQAVKVLRNVSFGLGMLLFLIPRWFFLVFPCRVSYNLIHDSSSCPMLKGIIYKVSHLWGDLCVLSAKVLLSPLIKWTRYQATMFFCGFYLIVRPLKDLNEIFLVYY